MNDLFSCLVLATLASSAAIALILTTRTAMTRQFGAQVTYALWMFVPLAALATMLPARTVVLVVTAIPASAEVAAIRVGDVATPGFSAAFDGSIDPTAWLCGLWICGVVASLLIFLVQHRRFVRRLGPLAPLAGDLYRARTIEGCPALVGIWRPRIVLPADFESRYSAPERELILAHERHHRARGDALVNAFATALRSAFWFNALVHCAIVCFMADQELACDAAVMTRYPNTRRIYANAMLKAQSGNFRAALACQWTPRNLLAERIARLAYPPIGRARRWLGNVAAVAMIVSGSAAAWASRPVETQMRFENALVSEVAAGNRRDGREVAATDPVVAQPQALPIVRDESLRSLPSPAHESVPRTVAAKPQRKASPTITRVATGAHVVASGEALAKLEPTPGTVAANDHSPREIASYRRDHAPAYPAAAARTHLQGKVVLDVGIDETGRPTDARIASLEPSTATELASASLAAVTQWRFEPAEHDGRAIASRIAVPFVFALDGDSTYAAPEAHRQASYRTVGSAGYQNDLADTEGVVYVRVRIENDGTVSSSEIARIDPPSAASLGPAALASLRTCTFNPARNGDKTIASTAIVPIVFGANARSSPDVARIRNSLDPIRLAPKRS